jgi:hypothetical protein
MIRFARSATVSGARRAFRRFFPMIHRHNRSCHGLYIVSNFMR